MARSVHLHRDTPAASFRMFCFRPLARKEPDSAIRSRICAGETSENRSRYRRRSGVDRNCALLLVSNHEGFPRNIAGGGKAEAVDRLAFRRTNPIVCEIEKLDVFAHVFLINDDEGAVIPPASVNHCFAGRERHGIYDVFFAEVCCRPVLKGAWVGKTRRSLASALRRTCSAFKITCCFPHTAAHAEPNYSPSARRLVLGSVPGIRIPLTIETVCSSTARSLP